MIDWDNTVVLAATATEVVNITSFRSTVVDRTTAGAPITIAQYDDMVHGLQTLGLEISVTGGGDATIIQFTGVLRGDEFYVRMTSGRFVIANNANIVLQEGGAGYLMDDVNYRVHFTCSSNGVVHGSRVV